MKIKTITYKRTKNLGNYESEYFEATAEIDDENEDVNEAIEKLKVTVHKALGLKLIEQDSQDNIDF